MADSLEQYYIYYPLALLMTATIIAAIFEVKWVQRYLVYLIILGWIVFVVKACVYYSTSTDFSVFWQGGQAIWRGENPYQDPGFVNPPTALPLYAVLGLLSKPTSLLIWTILTAVGTIILTFCAYRMLQAQDKTQPIQLPAQMLHGLSVVTALSLPAHFSHRLGQVTVVVALCLILSLYAQAKGKQILAGIACAVATIKIHTVLPFLLLFVSRKNWRFWLVFIVTVFNLSILVPGPFRLFEWMAMNLKNIAMLSQPGGTNDYSLLGPFYHNMVGLDSLFYHLGIEQRSWVKFCQTATMALLGFWIFREAIWRQHWSRAAACAIVALYATVFMYHRVQDAVILVIPLVYVVAQVKVTAKASRRLFITAMLAILTVLYWHPKFNLVLVAAVDRLQIDLLSRLVSAIFLPLHTWLILVSMALISAGCLTESRSRKTAVTTFNPAELSS